MKKLNVISSSICMHAILILALLWMFGPTICAAGPSDSRYDMAARSRLEMLTTNQTDVQWLQSVTNLPISIREKLGSVADAGKPFFKTCTGSDPHQRFLTATKQGTKYTVAVELEAMHIFGLSPSMSWTRKEQLSAKYESNQTVQRTGASRSAQIQIQRLRRLAPVTDLRH
jgi:hypothetical protein